MKEIGEEQRKAGAIGGFYGATVVSIVLMVVAFLLLRDSEDSRSR